MNLNILLCIFVINNELFPFESHICTIFILHNIDSLLNNKDRNE